MTSANGKAAPPRDRLTRRRGQRSGDRVSLPPPPDKRLTALEVRLVVGDDRDLLREPALALLQHLPDRFRHLSDVAADDLIVVAAQDFA